MLFLLMPNLSLASKGNYRVRLIQLKNKEIKKLEQKIKTLTENLTSLTSRKRDLSEKILAKKKSIHSKLKNLDRYLEARPLNVAWLFEQEVDTPKALFMAKLTEKQITEVRSLKHDLQSANNLENRITQEKDKLIFALVELKSTTSILASAKSIHLQIENPARFKGSLPMPVHGQIVRTFGRSYDRGTNLYRFQKGLTIESRSGEPVQAVYDGRVVYAGNLKNYGQIIILQHPGNFYSLYGQLGKIEVSDGKKIKQGELLAKTSSEPFYFEIRDKNVATNPLHWLSHHFITLTKK